MGDLINYYGNRIKINGRLTAEISRRDATIY